MEYRHALFTIIIIFFTSIFWAQPAAAQYSVGGGVLYGFQEEFGLNVFGEYQLREQFSIKVDGVWWPRSTPENASQRFTELNSEFKFIPLHIRNVRFYVSAIGGYHYAGAKIESMNETYRASSHMRALGAGGGILVDFGTISLTANARSFISGFNQTSIGGGVQFNF